MRDRPERRPRRGLRGLDHGRRRGLLLRVVTSANVACGFHAGDPSVIDRTVGLAVRAGVAVGAHPSHFDLRGFGRRTMVVDPGEVEARRPLPGRARCGLCPSPRRAPRPREAARRALQPGGGRRGAGARAVARGRRAVRREPDPRRASPPRPRCGARPRARACALPAEAFADRRYEPDGTLVSRSAAGRRDRRTREAAAQAVRIAQTGRGGRARRRASCSLRARDPLRARRHPGRRGPGAAVRERALEAAGVTVRALGALTRATRASCPWATPRSPSSSATRIDPPLERRGARPRPVAGASSPCRA